MEYIIQFSTEVTFPRNSALTYTYGPIQAFGTGPSTVSTGSPLPLYGSTSILPTAIRNAPTVYWRIGARNLQDTPGPLPDQYTHQRYIFSIASTFKPGGAVGPPAVKKKTSTTSHG
jgi:hypothetical protein